MLQLIFKLLRKWNIFFAGWIISYKVYKWKTLYPNRFYISGEMSFGKLFAIYFDSSSSEVKIGEGIQFRDFCQIRSGMNSKLIIGDRVFFNNNCSINCFHEIVIGNDCQFGEAVKIYDHNHQYKEIERKINEQGYSKGSIIIGNNCWVGSNVVFLKDIEIGDNVVIGTGCIIYKSVPSGTIVINHQSLNYKTYRS